MYHTSILHIESSFKEDIAALLRRNMSESHILSGTKSQSSLGFTRRKWADEVMISVKAGLVQRVDAYITGDLQKWVIEEVSSMHN